MSGSDSIARMALGRFAPGQSGNPAGRPKGARNRMTVFAEALRSGEADELMRKFLPACALSSTLPAGGRGQGSLYWACILGLR
jgi:Family of unknown function (DUF5681)